MKALLALALLLPAAAAADILSSFSPFLGSPAPFHTPQRPLHDPARAPFSPADSDLGVQQLLVPYPGLPPVLLELGLNASYTDNAPAATGADEAASGFFSALLAASWQPRIGAGWFADLGASAEMLRFDHASATDFESFRGHLGVAKSFTSLDDLLLFSHYEYHRITTGNWAQRGFAAHRLRTGIQKSLLLTTRQHLAAELSYAVDLHASPHSLERREAAATISYTYSLSDRLDSTLSWDCASWDFANTRRRDWRHTAGIEMSYRLTSRARLFASVFYSNHDSNQSSGIHDRDAWQGGIGLGLHHSF